MAKKGRPREKNPIAKHLLEIMKENGISREKISVILDVSHFTFYNVFTKDKVSRNMIFRLKTKNLINDNVIMEYERWKQKKGL
jgi:hypothetical protein